MKREYISVIAEFMINNDIDFLKKIEENLYLEEYITFEAFISNAGVIFSDATFCNDLPDWESNIYYKDNVYIFNVEEVFYSIEKIQEKVNEMLNEIAQNDADERGM